MAIFSTGYVEQSQACWDSWTDMLALSTHTHIRLSIGQRGGALSPRISRSRATLLQETGCSLAKAQHPTPKFFHDYLCLDSQDHLASQRPVCCAPLTCPNHKFPETTFESLSCWWVWSSRSTNLTQNKTNIYSMRILWGSGIHKELGAHCHIEAKAYQGP